MTGPSDMERHMVAALAGQYTTFAYDAAGMRVVTRRRLPLSVEAQARMVEGARKSGQMRAAQIAVTFSDVEAALLQRMRAEGASFETLAATVGCSTTPIRKFFGRLGGRG